MTVLESLAATSAFPIPPRTFESIAVARGLNIREEVSSETIASAEYKLATADVMQYLLAAPSISQGGQSYSLTEDQRNMFRRKSEAIYAKYGEAGDGSGSGVTYGYKGSRL